MLVFGLASTFVSADQNVQFRDDALKLTSDAVQMRDDLLLDLLLTGIAMQDTAHTLDGAALLMTHPVDQLDLLNILATVQAGLPLRAHRLDLAREVSLPLTQHLDRDTEHLSHLTDREVLLAG